MRSLLIFLAVPLVTQFYSRAVVAGGPCSGVRGGCHRTSYVTEPRWTAPSYRSSSLSATCRTWVKGHTRNGNHVEGHYRETSCSGSGSKSSYRSEARTSARWRFWEGTGSDDDEQPTEEDRRRYARPTRKALDETDDDPGKPVNIPKAVVHPNLPAKYRVYFSSKKERDIADFEDRDDSYRLQWITGGYALYPKSMIDRIEPLH
jgi:hypothetical protein